ncbi:acyltransferase [Halomonas getboli]|uniref:acyltransferase n=1 Tax=Halomonas getboli TaxID=2935862 RepID=UPI001FFEC849|nr:acyltransferase [Halomonas getboli]MCK2182997.1 acyltransferase [Halomonas getboli]
MKLLSKKIIGICFYPVVKIKPLWRKAEGLAYIRRVKNKGERCVFEGGGDIIDPEKLILGCHVYIGRGFFIRATGGVFVGDYTHISRNVTIHTVNHNKNGKLLPYDRQDIVKPINIGSYVWVGMNSNILQGVTIGDGAIIGMGATVTKDVGPGEIVVGASQRVVGSRDDRHTIELVRNGSYLKL